MLLENFWNRDQNKEIKGKRLYLRYPVLNDWRQWSALRHESRHHLVPWEPVWTTDTLTRKSFKERLRRYSADARIDTGYAFFLFTQEDHQLVGSITLSNIRRGVAQMGTVGYWTGLPFVRQGYMQEGLSVLLPVLFGRYGLRRVEAACLPENVASADLLKKVGFTHEGRARQYLCINGNWHDHLLFGMLKGDSINPPDVKPPLYK